MAPRHDQHALTEGRHPDSPAAAETAAGAPQPDLAEATMPGAVPCEPVAAAEDDLIAEERERGPLRRCVVTRESLPKEAMLRFVLGPDRSLVPDLEGRLPGRGMWLSARADVLERALHRGAFSKAARGPVHVPPDLRARIEDGLRRRVRDFVGFARRGGQAVCGWQAVREWLQAGRVGLLVEASDGSPSERARLLGTRRLPLVTPLTAEALGAVFGRDHAVHVAIAPGKLADGIAGEAARLAGITGAASPAEGTVPTPHDGG
jgi:predicted RNA-binding protein YlxR (DUF448 family)